MPTVLITAPYILPYMHRFRPILEHYGLELILPGEVQERMEEADLLALAGQFDGAICGDDRYTARVMECCAPRLKIISKWGTGIDSIDREAATRLGIRIGNTPNAFTLPVADSVMGYMLSFARRLPWMDRDMKGGLWDKIPGRSLSECTLGVVGVGNIGKAVLRRARSFGMKLLGNDIVSVAPDFLLENGVEMTSLPELLKRSDFVSLSTDLNPTSHHLMNPATFAYMQPSSVLINCSRGPVVDERALIRALQSGKIAGAAMDVFEDEPLPADSPLKGMDNVFLAPHNANSSPRAWENIHRSTIEHLMEELERRGA